MRAQTAQGGTRPRLSISQTLDVARRQYIPGVSLHRVPLSPVSPFLRRDALPLLGLFLPDAQQLEPLLSPADDNIRVREAFCCQFPLDYDSQDAQGRPDSQDHTGVPAKW